MTTSDAQIGRAQLTPAELRGFIQQGVVIRRRAVSRQLLDAAAEQIRRVRDHGEEAGQLAVLTQTTFAPALRSDPTLLALYYDSPLHALASSLVSPDLLQPVTTVQVQIRLPGTTQPRKEMHLDGVACPHLDVQELRTFTLLAGVLLTEVVDIDGGALRYLPGAHVEMAEWFRSGWQLGDSDQVPLSLSERKGRAFLGDPGDAILMHHLVPHAVGWNLGSTERVMVYFRLKHEKHQNHLLAALRDPWLEFPGLSPESR
jgi:hypothetical protein